MIGNDIVDLSLAQVQSNLKRRGFLQKIFSKEEQLFLLQKEESERANYIWLFWSMKEAAYKIVSRKEQRRFYKPTAFVCTLSEKVVGPILGSVTYGKEFFSTESLLKSDYIYTVTAVDSLNLPINLSNQVLELNATKALNSSALYIHTLEQYAKYQNQNLSNLSIQKCSLNSPYIYNKQTNEMKAISLTHHGRYAGFYC